MRESSNNVDMNTYMQKHIEVVINLIKDRLPEKIDFKFMWDKPEFKERKNTIYIKISEHDRKEYAGIVLSSSSPTLISLSYNAIKGFHQHLLKFFEIANIKEKHQNKFMFRFFYNIVLHEILHYFQRKHGLNEDEELTREITKYYLDNSDKKITISDLKKFKKNKIISK